ncbi:peptidoglycan binding [Homalodisca vitripennis]|nr:peptidoglycan binding [Homalodisca vitripennis]
MFLTSKAHDEYLVCYIVLLCESYDLCVMSDLVVRDIDEVCDIDDDDSLEGYGAIQTCPSTSYGGLTVTQSSEVHVGAKYVADKIVIVLPKSDNVDFPNHQRNELLQYAKKIREEETKRLCASFSVNPDLKVIIFLVIVSVLIIIGVLIIFLTSFFTSSEVLTPTATYENSFESSYYTRSVSSLVSTTSIETTKTTSSDFSHSTNYFGTTENSYDKSSSSSSFSSCKVLGSENYQLVSSTLFINVTKMSTDKTCLVRRDEWGSVACSSCVPFKNIGTVNNVSIHFIDSCESLETCTALMRVYQSQYINTTDNFLYNFVIGGDCRIYEGLGWDLMLPDSETLHVGIQMWSGQGGNTNRLTEKQLYNLMLLVYVGNWCYKLASKFSYKYVCPIMDCMKYFAVQRNIRHLANNEYYILDKETTVFNQDSLNLGRMFSTCNSYTFNSIYSLCKNLLCGDTRKSIS